MEHTVEALEMASLNINVANTGSTELVMSESDEEWLHLKPTEPLPSQCCGSGCRPCVFDIYEGELERWTQAKAKKDKSLLTRKREEPKLKSVEQLTEDTYLYTFALPSETSLGLKLGQHIVLRGTVNGLEIQRAYTPVNSVDTTGYFDVLIKVTIYEEGLMSHYIKSWKRGDRVFWRGPFGGFPYRPNQYGQLIMLASGTGLAPMLPILQHITANEEDETFVILVGCFRTFKDIYMKQLLLEQSRYWNIRTFYALSKEESLEKLSWSYRENTHLGRITKSVIANLINSCKRKPFVLICGSLTFNDDMVSCLKSLGIEEDSYFVF
nr:PREDICTED: NADH-cytochrome b5 reductase-like isoform X3 [Latimeria chalumnae]|eukprot:XP_014347844.1 PREDICTED: NADH-cytochrome b5 reductase-like isoform X3 [Latimeria chalumnae]